MSRVRACAGGTRGSQLTPSGELRRGGRWTQGSPRTEPGLGGVGRGQRVHGPSPRPVRPHRRAGQWLTAAGVSWSAGLEVLRAVEGGSPVCELCVMWSKAGTGAWEGGAPESGPGKPGGWTKPIGRGSQCWKWGCLAGDPQPLPEVEQTGLVLPARQCPPEAPGLGRGSRGLSLQSSGTAALTA